MFAYAAANLQNIWFTGADSTDKHYNNIFKSSLLNSEGSFFSYDVTC